MLYSSRPVSMGLAFLRIYVGLLWLDHGVRMKILNPRWFGDHGMFAASIHGMVAKAPALYRDFLEAVVLPNVSAFSYVIACGETLVGLSLVLGLYSRVGALAGMFMTLNYFLAKGGGGVRGAWFGGDATVFMLCALHAIVPTGMFFGLDGRLGGYRALRNSSRTGRR